jgi:N-acetylglucosamine malate deacetylase 2
MTHAAAVSYRPPASVLADPGHREGRGGRPGLHGTLPRARNLLAVVSRPGQESVDLGGLLYAYRRSGARLALLCLTRGEASPLNSSLERLETLRPWELQVAAGLLGVSSITVVDYPDGRLSGRRAGQLIERVCREVRRQAPDLLLVVDPDDGSPDDVAVAAATQRAGQRAGLPVLARCMPGGSSGWLADLGPHAAAARAAARSAAAAHASQSDGLAGVQCRLGLLDGQERLRWLAPAHRGMTR